MKKLKKVAIPKNMSIASKKWIKHILETWEVPEDKLRILVHAGEAWDTAEKAHEDVLRLGTVYADRYGQPKIRPEVHIERNNKALFAKLVILLNLESDSTPN